VNNGPCDNVEFSRIASTSISKVYNIKVLLVISYEAQLYIYRRKVHVVLLAMIVRNTKLDLSAC